MKKGIMEIIADDDSFNLNNPDDSRDMLDNSLENDERLPSTYIEEDDN